MFGLKSTLLFVFVASRFATSYQKPIDDVDTNKKVSELQFNDMKVNNSDRDGMPMAMETTRSAMYPSSGGMMYLSNGQVQMQMPIRNYPFGLLNQQYQTPGMTITNSMYTNEEASRTDPRAVAHLRPLVYSQYQSAPSTNPQLYAYQLPKYHARPYSYEYSSSSTPATGSHYSVYPAYPVYIRDAEEETPKQFTNAMSSEKYMSPVRPGFQYVTKYVMGNPNENMDVQPPMTEPMVIRNAMPAQWQFRSSQAQPRGVFIDDQLQMQIPSNYLAEKMQHYTLPNDAQSTLLVQPMMSRATDESKPMEWNQRMYLNQPSNGDLNQQMSDTYVSPKDIVYMEPYVAADPAPCLSPKSVEPSVPLATYPNHQQQFRIAQIIQPPHNAMNNVADQIEPANKEYVDQKKASPNFQPASPMDPASRNVYRNSPPPMETGYLEEKSYRKELAAQFELFRKAFEEYLETQKQEKNTKSEPPKQENKDQSAPSLKTTDASATANGSAKRT